MCVCSVRGSDYRGPACVCAVLGGQRACMCVCMQCSGVRGPACV